MITVKDNCRRDTKYNLQEALYIGDIKEVTRYSRTILFTTTEGYDLEMDEYEAKRIGLAVFRAKGKTK